MAKKRLNKLAWTVVIVIIIFTMVLWTVGLALMN